MSNIVFVQKKSTNGLWEVRIENARRATAVRGTQKAALTVARVLARKRAGWLFIRNSEGLVRETSGYAGR